MDRKEKNGKEMIRTLKKCNYYVDAWKIRSEKREQKINEVDGNVEKDQT